LRWPLRSAGISIACGSRARIGRAGPCMGRGSMRHEHTTSLVRCEIARDEPAADPGQTADAHKAHARLSRAMASRDDGDGTAVNGPQIPNSFSCAAQPWWAAQLVWAQAQTHLSKPALNFICKMQVRSCMCLGEEGAYPLPLGFLHRPKRRNFSLAPCVLDTEHAPSDTEQAPLDRTLLSTFATPAPPALAATGVTRLCQTSTHRARCTRTTRTAAVTAF
jgi:hypothetical protein